MLRFTGLNAALVFSITVAFAQEFAAVEEPSRMHSSALMFFEAKPIRVSANFSFDVSVKQQLLSFPNLAS